MPSAATPSKLVRALEIFAFAPILAALLLGSLPVLLAASVVDKLRPRPAE